jgi:hypothetical protein
MASKPLDVAERLQPLLEKLIPEHDNGFSGQLYQPYHNQFGNLCGQLGLRQSVWQLWSILANHSDRNTDDPDDLLPAGHTRFRDPRTHRHAGRPPGAIMLTI